MKVLVTGSTGHIGGAIARHLHALGHEVTGLSRHTDASLSEDILQVCADIADSDVLNVIHEHAAACDAIIHAAANLDKRLLSAAITEVNCVGTQQMLHLAEQWDVQRFVFVSGVAVIGRPREVPITESHPCHPVTAYHASKLYGEHLTSIAARLGRCASTLRVSSPVGPRTPRGRIMRVFVEQALANERIALNGAGKRRQNYVDVRDVAGAVERCLATPAPGTFNIGGAETISNFELAERCIATVNSSSTIEFSGGADSEDDDDWTLSIDKAARKLHYVPRHNVEASIRAIAEEC